MNFEDKYEMLIVDMKSIIGIIAYHDGEASDFYNHKVLKPDDDFQINLNTNYNGFVKEVSSERLISNEGHIYEYTQIDFEELCQLVDHLQVKYIDE